MPWEEEREVPSSQPFLLCLHRPSVRGTDPGKGFVENCRKGQTLGSASGYQASAISVMLSWKEDMILDLNYPWTPAAAAHSQRSH